MHTHLAQRLGQSHGRPNAQTNGTRQFLRAREGGEISKNGAKSLRGATLLAKCPSHVPHAITARATPFRQSISKKSLRQLWL